MHLHHVLVDSTSALQYQETSDASQNQVEQVTNDLHTVIVSLLRSSKCENFTFHAFNSLLPSAAICQTLQMSPNTLENMQNEIDTNLRLTATTPSSTPGFDRNASICGVTRVLQLLVRKIRNSRSMYSAKTTKHTVYLLSCGLNLENETPTSKSVADLDSLKEKSLSQPSHMVQEILGKLNNHKIDLVWIIIEPPYELDRARLPVSKKKNPLETWARRNTNIEIKYFSNLLKSKRLTESLLGCTIQNKLRTDPHLKEGSRKGNVDDGSAARIVFSQRDNNGVEMLVCISNVRILSVGFSTRKAKKETMFLLSHYVKKWDSLSSAKAFADAKPRTLKPRAADEAEAFASFMSFLSHGEMAAVANELTVDHGKQLFDNRQILIVPYTSNVASVCYIPPHLKQFKSGNSSLPKSYRQWQKWHSGGQAVRMNAKSFGSCEASKALETLHSTSFLGDAWEDHEARKSAANIPGENDDTKRKGFETGIVDIENTETAFASNIQQEESNRTVTRNTKISLENKSDGFHPNSSSSSTMPKIPKVLVTVNKNGFRYKRVSVDRPGVRNRLRHPSSEGIQLEVEATSEGVQREVEVISEGDSCPSLLIDQTTSNPTPFHGLKKSIRKLDCLTAELSNLSTECWELIVREAMSQLSVISAKLATAQYSWRELNSLAKLRLRSVDEVIASMQTRQKAFFSQDHVEPKKVNGKLWRAVIEAFEQVIWLLLKLTNPKSKGSLNSRKKPELFRRATTILSCAQVTAELTSTISGSAQVFHSALDMFFNSTLKHFAQASAHVDLMHWTRNVFEYFEKDFPKNTSSVNPESIESGPKKTSLASPFGEKKNTRKTKDKTRNTGGRGNDVSLKSSDNLSNLLSGRRRPVHNPRHLRNHPTFRKGKVFAGVSKKKRKTLNSKPLSKQTCPSEVLDRLIHMGSLQSSLDAIKVPEADHDSFNEAVEATDDEKDRTTNAVDMAPKSTRSGTKENMTTSELQIRSSHPNGEGTFLCPEIMKPSISISVGKGSTEAASMPNKKGRAPIEGAAKFLVMPDPSNADINEHLQPPKTRAGHIHEGQLETPQFCSKQGERSTSASDFAFDRNDDNSTRFRSTEALDEGLLLRSHEVKPPKEKSKVLKSICSIKCGNEGPGESVRAVSDDDGATINAPKEPKRSVKKRLLSRDDSRLQTQDPNSNHQEPILKRRRKDEKTPKLSLFGRFR